ncbi:hypothetical protein AAE478_009261 [Parahypoxylon ruwenzoriense]
MTPHAKETGEFLGYVGAIACYRCKLRGNGITDANSNWRLWNADVKVYRAAKPSPEDRSDEVFASKEEELLAKADRVRKAIMWFTVSEELREQHLLDMGGTDKSSEDVFRRLYERVAPPGTPYEPLERLQVPDRLLRKIKNDKEAEVVSGNE